MRMTAHGEDRGLIPNLRLSPIGAEAQILYYWKRNVGFRVETRRPRNSSELCANPTFLALPRGPGVVPVDFMSGISSAN